MSLTPEGELFGKRNAVGENIMSNNEIDYSNAWKALEKRAAEIQMNYFDDEEDSKGYVIRCVNQFSGRVLFRGNKRKYTREKDSLRPEETYTYTGAKKALKNLERLYPEGEFYSIEKLSSYYDNFDSDTQDTEDYREKIYADIEHAMVRLDELCDGNDFHRGDIMRINEVRAVLKRIKEKLLRQ